MSNYKISRRHNPEDHHRQFTSARTAILRKSSILSFSGYITKFLRGEIEAEDMPKYKVKCYLQLLQDKCLIFYVLVITIMFLLVVTPCRLVGRYQRFRETYYTVSSVPRWIQYVSPKH
jgi:hypothetical protein